MAPVTARTEHTEWMDFLEVKKYMVIAVQASPSPAKNTFPLTNCAAIK